MAKKTHRFPLTTDFGNQLRSELDNVIERSKVRHLILQDNRGTIGVLVDLDEFNLLMELATLVDTKEGLTELLEDAKDETDPGFTFEEVFENRRGI
jgi:hypothetical protein